MEQEKRRTIQRREDLQAYLYIAGKKKLLKKIRAENAGKTYASQFEEWRTSPENRPEKVLRIDLRKQSEFKDFRNYLRREYPRPEIRFFHAGLSPQFKYCVEENRDPEIEDELNSLRLELSRPRIAEKSLKGLNVNGEKYRSESRALEKLNQKFSGEGPDVLRISRSEVLTLVDEKTSFSLGRDSGLEKLAEENTVTAYGKTVHSPSRYSVSGRAVIDESSSFMLSDAGMQGLYDLVSRTWKPLQ